MLTELREKSQSFLIYVLFGVLIFVFIFFFGPQSEGCQSGGSGVKARRGWAATVSGAGDSLELTQEEVELQLRRQAAVSRLSLSDLQAGELAQMRHDVLMQMVDQARIAQKAKSMGLAVGEDELNKFIISKKNRDFGLFAVKVGAGNTLDDYRFDFETYKATIRQGFGTSAEQYRAIIGQELLVSRYLDFLTEQIQVSDAEVKTAYDRKETQWNLEFVVFDTKQISGEIAPATAEEGAAYAKANAEAVAKNYEDNKKLYVHDKEVKIRRISLKVPQDATEAEKAEIKKKAEEVLAKAKAEGANFEALASEYSEDYFKSFGGDMSWKGVENSPEADYKVYAALEKGQISELQDSNNSFWFVKADDIRPAINRPLDEVKVEIGTALATKNKRQAKAKAEAQALLAKAKTANSSLSALAGGEKPAEEGGLKMPSPGEEAPSDEGSAEEAPAAPSFKVQETGLFSDERPSWDIIPRLGKVPALAAKLDSLTTEAPLGGEVYQADDRFYVVRLKERKAPDAEAFESQQADLKLRLRRQRQAQIMGQWQVYLFGPSRLREIYQQRGLGILDTVLTSANEDPNVKINTQAFPAPVALPQQGAQQGG